MKRLALAGLLVMALLWAKRAVDQEGSGSVIPVPDPEYGGTPKTTSDPAPVERLTDAPSAPVESFDPIHAVAYYVRVGDDVLASLPSVVPKGAHCRTGSAAGESSVTSEPIPLSIRWGGWQQVFEASKDLGLRVVALDKADRIIGEVPSALEPHKLCPFSGSLMGFSSVVRRVHGSAPPGVDCPDGSVSAWALLIPRPLEDRLRRMVLSEFRTHSVPVTKARDVVGRFIRDQGGSYRFEVTRVVWEEGHEE